MAEKEATMQGSTESMQHRIGDVSRQIQRDYVAPAMDSVKDVVAERPMSSLVTVFGAGVAVGLVLATLITSSTPRRRQSTAARLGEQVLDAVSSVLPQSLATHINR